MPENGHPATGLIRTVVKDSTDQDASSFLDSDGHYGDNSARNTLNPDPVDDGAWHMVRAPRQKAPAAACAAVLPACRDAADLPKHANLDQDRG